MNLGRLSRGEWIAMAGGLVLAIGVFLKWYESTSPDNGELAGVSGLSTASAWDTHPILRWLLLAAAAAPFILAYIIARDHQLSWPRGQVTSVVAIAALGLMLMTGIILRPGEPKSAIELEYGWYVAMAGGLLMLVGSVIRQAETEVKRKPPGTI
jgi:hypothetical protein